MKNQMENNVELLLELNNGDFSVWRTVDQNNNKFYNIEIEGYIGYKDVNSFIILYENFKRSFYNYLDNNNYRKPVRNIWKKVYQTRSIEICYEANCYWIFLEPYSSPQIWDLYYYLEDVINQIRQYINQCGNKNYIT